MTDTTATPAAPGFTFPTRSFAIATWAFAVILVLLVLRLPEEVKRTAGFVGAVHLLFDALCIAWLVPDARARGIRLGVYIPCLIVMPEPTLAVYVYKTRGWAGVGEWLGKTLLLGASAGAAAAALAFCAKHL